jgi:hypothetical protein
MAGFQQNNFSSQTTSGDTQKKRTNFPVGKIYGTDGQLSVSVWNSDKGGVYAIMGIKSAVGKDPSTGGNVYEQKMSGELPSIFMNTEILRALIEAMKDTKPENVAINIDTQRGSKMTINGSGASVKITIENQKTGTRTITLDSTPVGMTSINASYMNLLYMLNICFKKAINNKLDPDEFAMAVASSSDEGNNDETPF